MATDTVVQPTNPEDSQAVQPTVAVPTVPTAAAEAAADPNTAIVAGASASGLDMAAEPAAAMSSPAEEASPVQNTAAALPQGVATAAAASVPAACRAQYVQTDIRPLRNM